MCFRYNCDEQDTFWLSNINKELFPFLEGCDASLGSFLSPELLEFVFDFLEETVHGRLQLLINSEKGEQPGYSAIPISFPCTEWGLRLTTQN